MQELTELDHNISGISLVFICTFGIIVNIYLLYSLFTKNKAKEQKPNILIVNLAGTNIAIIVLAFPLSTIAAIERKWIWGDTLCTYYGSIALLFGYGIMISAIMIVFDIYLNLRINDFDAYKNQTRKLMMIFTWANSIFWSGAPLLGWSRINYEPTGLSCTVDMMNPDIGYKTYIMATAFFIYFLPIFLMFTLRFINITNIDEKNSLEANIEIKKAILISMLYVFEWTPYALAYLWPIFLDPKTMPLRLSLAGPIFAKTAVILTPLVFIYYQNEPEANNNTTKQPYKSIKTSKNN